MSDRTPSSPTPHEPFPLLPRPHQRQRPNLRASAIPQRTNQEKYRDRITRLDHRGPTRGSRWLAYAGWISGAMVGGWMLLYEDFGQREHCFSGIRRQYRHFMKSMFNLSPQERNMLGLERKDGERVVRSVAQRRALEAADASRAKNAMDSIKTTNATVRVGEENVNENPS